MGILRLRKAANPAAVDYYNEQHPSAYWYRIIPMKKRLLGLVALCLLSGHLWAEEPKLRTNVPDTYTVVKGDTLWDISGRFLQNPWMWPEIWHVNPQIANPHLIYPGDVIKLVYIDGKPRLSLDRGMKKLSPSVKVIEGDKAITTIPLDKISAFLSKARIVSPEELKQAPYVVSGQSERLLSGKGDRVYARGFFDPDISAYGIYREGQTFKDPKTREVLGVYAADIGAAKMRSLDNDIATLLMTRSNEEVRLGDRLLLDEGRSIESNFVPSSPSSEIEGEIIFVEGGVTQVGKMDVVLINKGSREDLAVGNVLAINKRGAEVRDRVRGDKVRLPDERAGLVMVFRTFEKLSLGLVLEAERPLSVGDKVLNP
jgi:nucleoid-associated protein YgaU